MRQIYSLKCGGFIPRNAVDSFPKMRRFHSEKCCGNNTDKDGYEEVEVVEVEDDSELTAQLEEMEQEQRRLEAEQKEREENERLLKEGPDWLQGRWKLDLTDDYGFLGTMYSTFDHGKLIISVG